MSKTLSKTEKATKLAFIFGGRELCSCWAQGSEDNYVLATKQGNILKDATNIFINFQKIKN